MSFEGNNRAIMDYETEARAAGWIAEKEYNLADGDVGRFRAKHVRRGWNRASVAKTVKLRGATMTPIETFIATVKHIASTTHDDATGYGLSVALSNFERDQTKPIPDWRLSRLSRGHRKIEEPDFTVGCYCDLVADPQECRDAGYCKMKREGV